MPFDPDADPTDLVIQEDFIFSIKLNHKKTVSISISADTKPSASPPVTPLKRVSNGYHVIPQVT